MELATPRRARLAEALACVTDADADEWRCWLDAGVSLDCSSTRIYDSQRRYTWRITVPVPDEAWEIMAARGLVPVEWVGAPRYWQGCPSSGAIHRAPDGREYSHLRSAPRECSYCAGRNYVVTTTPCCHAGSAGCAALASDVPGLVTAEALARQITGCTRVIWHVEDRWSWLRAAHAAPLSSLKSWWRRDPDLAAAPAGIVDLRATGYAIDSVTGDDVVLVAPAL